MENGDFEMGDETGTNGQVVIGPVNPGGDAGHEKGNEDRKIFVGGLSYETTNEDLVAYFGQWGEVKQAQVKFDQLTGRSRGFAFVEFANASSVSEVLKQREREIKGKKVEVKPAKSRENKKIFVGGLPADFAEEELRAHFEKFGKVDDVEWPLDRARGVRRNFAFVVFEEEAGADAASEETKQQFGDRMCDVKKAVPQPKRAMMGMGGAVGGRGGGRGRGRGAQGGQYGYGGMGGYGAAGGYGGGWGDYYGSGGYGNYYGTGYGGGGGGYGGYDESAAYNTDNYNYWSGWGQYGAGGAGGSAGYDSYGQAQGGAGGAQTGRGGRYQAY